MKQILLVIGLITFSHETFCQQLADRVSPFPRTITVTGSSEMEIIPNEIYVVVDLQEYQKKGQDKIAIDRIKSTFLQECKAIGSPDWAITIASYDGYTNYWEKKKEQVHLYSS